MFGQRLGFDPRSDPRAEKPGRKQRRKAYLRAMKSCGKPALFSQNPSEGVPIDSSHAGGHWFESSSLHQILGNQVFPRIFSVFLQTSDLLIFCWNLKNQENTHMARIKMPAARSTAKEITFEEAFALGLR